jgi:hypothetical protein
MNRSFWFAICLFLSVMPRTVNACSCAPTTARDAEKRADIVFRGKLVRHSWRTAVFQVNEQWKGSLGPRVEVEWRRGDRGDCNGFWPDSLKVGNELLVFAIRGSDGIYRTSICLPTKQLSDATQEFKELGPGQLPRKD